MMQVENGAFPVYLSEICSVLEQRDCFQIMWCYGEITGVVSVIYLL